MSFMKRAIGAEPVSYGGFAAPYFLQCWEPGLIGARGIPTVAPAAAAARPSLGADSAKGSLDMTAKLLAATLAIVALFLGSAGVSAQTRIRNAGELEAALSKARGGEVLQLAPGHYGDLLLRGKASSPIAFARPVTITSLDPGARAVFGSVTFFFVQNITFSEVDFTYVYKEGEKANASPFQMRDVSDITITRSHFTGDNARGTGTGADGYATARGVFFLGGRNIRVQDNVFRNWHRAGVFGRIEGLTVSGNEVADNRSDGFNFADVRDVLIERNYLHSFRINLATGDHPDMIQFWTNGTKAASERIVIRDNFLDVAGGGITQSIFMRNEEVDKGRAGAELFYRDVRIVGNVIRNGHVHGITVGETNGLVIANNTLLQSVTPPRLMHVTVPAINIKPASINVRIENNISPRYPTPSPGWTVTDNIQIQRNFPRGKDFYNAWFVDALPLGALPRESLQLLPGALDGRPKAGSSLLRFDDRPASPRLLIGSTTVAAGRASEQRFEVTEAFGPQGRIDLTGASFEWTLPDGEIRHGASATHRFVAAGLHRVEARATLQDGRVLTGARTLLAE